MRTVSGVTERELPRYEIHKEVYALRIEGITTNVLHGDAMIHPFEKEYASFRVSGEWLEKHSPKVGGYFVYDILSRVSHYCPAKAFEEGHSLIQ